MPELLTPELEETRRVESPPDDLLGEPQTENERLWQVIVNSGLTIQNAVRLATLEGMDRTQRARFGHYLFNVSDQLRRKALELFEKEGR